MGGGRLGTKIVNSMMAVVLVLGLSPITKASASSSSSASNSQDIEYLANSGADNGAVGTAAEGEVGTDDSTVNGEDSTEADLAGEGSASNGSAESAGAGSADGGSANGSNAATQDSSEAAPHSSEDGIAPASDSDASSGTYNPDAAFVDVSAHCDASSKLYKDADHNEELGSAAIAANETFYAQMAVNFQDGYRPTLSNPNVMYKFPDNLKVADMPETNLMDGNNIAGTWYIKDNVAYFKYSESYLSQTVLHAYANINCSLGGVNKGDGDSVIINFPGSSTSVTVNTKDGSVNGSKFGGDMGQTWNGPTYDQATNSYTWTIKISPNAHATNVKIEDTIGSNLTFADGSFKLVDASGQQVSGQCDVSVSGQSATISLGDLAAGDYCVQYKTYVNSLPTADNTAISNVDNKAKYSWGASDNRKSGNTDKTPQEAKYSMVSKSADGSSTPSAIKWVVKLNNGSIKADMGGYTFSDTLDADQIFTNADIEIKDSDGNTVSTTVAKTDSSLSFKLPADAGEKEYTVTYYTQMTDTDSTDAVSNTAEVTPSDPTHGPAGKGTGTYNPPDSGTYITKALTSTPSYASYDGTATWKSEILFGDMSSSTKASSIEFKDVFSNLPSGVLVSLEGDVTLTVGDGGVALVEGVDYTISTKSSQSTWGELIKINFMDSDKVRALIGKDGAKVVVTYKTKTTQVSGEYPVGTYKNKSSIKTDKKNKVSAEAEYTFEKEVTPPAVIKKGGTTSWDADYRWSDGSTGAWATNWTVYVNLSTDEDGHEWSYKPALDLQGKSVTVTDLLPASPYTFIEGDASYELRIDPWNSQASGTAEVLFDQDNAYITVPTSAANVPVYVQLTYQTVSKGSIDTDQQLTNTAQASSGDYTFPEGSDTVSFSNKALSKTGEAVFGSSARKYTITVNENAYDLVPGSDTLTLVDDLDYRGEFAASAISVTSPEGIDLLASGQASYELSKIGSGGDPHTRLTVTVPDGMKVVVSYQVVPSGSQGDEMKDFSNSCKLSGVQSSEVNLVQTFVVAASSGGTSSESWGVELTKYDSSGKKSLEGATFELHKVDLDKSTSQSIVEEKVAEATTDSTGKVSFGTEDEPLSSNTLYYFVETKAPDGYEISYTGNTYVMLKSDATKGDYQAAYDKAVELGLTPSSSRTYSAFDELEKGSFNLEVEKNVEGAEAPADAQFTFKAEATGDNASSAPKLDDVTITTDAKGQKTYTGKFTGSLSDSMKGQTFTYKVSETASAAGGWTYDSGEYTATVQVVEQDGKLVGNVSYAKGDAAADKMSFTNTYKTSGTPVLHVKKTVNGGAASEKFKDKDFKFGLYNADEEGHKTGNLIQDIQCTPSDNYAYFNWGEKYTESGTHRYVIHEEGTPEEGWTFADDVLVTVTAADNGKGSLDLTYEYSTATADGTKALFDNTYAEATSATLQAKKVLTGRNMIAGEFSFQVIDQNEGEHKGSVIDTKTASTARDGEAATVAFDSLSFSKPGTYTYSIKEVKGSLANVDYDETVYTAQVVVTKDDATGKLSSEVHYLKAGEQLDAMPTFNNTYTAPATGQFQLKVKKTVNGAAPKAGEKFNFTVMYESGYEGAKKVADIIEDATTDDSGMATFGTVSLGEEFYGKEFVLRIHETNQLDKEWAKGLDVLATVSVSQPEGSEQPTVIVKYDKVEAQYASFNNTYSTKADSGLKVSKTVNGGTEAVAGEWFEFELKDADGTVVSTAKTQAGGTASFEGIEYTTADAGKTFEYTVHEVGHNDKGWTADSDVKVTVKVSENTDRSLKVEVDYGRGTNAAEFTNVFAPAKAELKLKKTVNGGALFKGESFGFTLDSVDSSTGELTKVANATVDADTADGTVLLANLTFSEPGTYSYKLSEDLNTAEGWVNADDVDFSFEVGYSADGHSLVATLNDPSGCISQSDGVYTAALDNLYCSEATAVLKAHKTIEDATAAAEGKEFKFELKDESGQVIDAKTAKGGQTVGFDELTYSSQTCGTYTYTISESAADGSTAGWTFQDPVTATVEVGMDTANRQVEVKSIEYSKSYADADGTESALFANKYASEGNAEIKVYKTVNGGTEAAEGEEFTFELYQAKKDEATGEWVKDGEAIDSTSVKAGGIAAFQDKDGKRHYTQADDGKTFTYIVHETGHNEGGWFAASDVLATVKVFDNGDGTMKAEVTYSNGTNAAAFDNVKSSTTGKIELYKTVNGGPAKPEESFTFQLQPQDGAPAAKQADITVNGGGRADFGDIEFTEPGEYRYVIHETSELGDGWTNDADIEVTVKVVRDEGGKRLKIESIDYGERTYEVDGEVMAHFDNKYVAPETPKEEGTQPKGDEKVATQKASTTKTGDSLMVVGVAAAVIAVVAAGAVVATSRRRKG